MICRPAVPSDIPWLTDTTLAIYRNVFVPLLPRLDLSSFSEAYFAERFGEAWPKVRIVSRNDQPLGFSMLSDGHIDMLFVAEEGRGAGCGKVLLNDAEARGAKTLESFSANMAARRFYERHSWKLAAAYARPFAGVECTFVRYVRS